MIFSIRTLILVTAWIAICIAVLLSKGGWQIDLAILVAYFGISVSITVPFWCPRSHFRFWTGYAVTTTVFLACVWSGDWLARPVIDRQISLLVEGLNKTGMFSGYSPEYSIASKLRALLTVSVPPVAGLLSGSIVSKLGRPIELREKGS